MENEIIKLDNGYYLEAGTGIKINENNIDIANFNIKNVKKIKNIILYLNFNEIQKKDYKIIVKRLLKLKKICKLYNIKIGSKINESKILLGYVENYNKSENQKELIEAINAIGYNTRKERYNYIYDTVCDYLDNYFYGKNLCDFVNNKCGEKRNTTSTWGCCRHYKVKLLGPLTQFVKCEYLGKNYICKIKCISCKLYTCDYLKNKGIEFKIRDILLLDAFFNPIQKYFIKYMVYTPKEKIIKRLLIT